MSGKGHRFESLDSLRGIAAVTVVCSHINLDYFEGGSTTPLKNTPLHIFYDGEAAVVFFFVLSGFVLSYKYLADSEGLKKLSFRSFLVSRIFRIYPLFWAALALTAFCAMHFSHSVQNIPPRAWTIWWYQQPFSLSGFLRQCTLIYIDPVLGKLIGQISGDNFIPQCWSLSVELILSVLVPCLALIAVNRSSWLIFFTAVMVGVFNVNPFMMHFALGILMAFHLPQINSYLQTKGAIFKTILLAAGILLYSYRYSVVPHFEKVSALQIILFSDNSIYLVIGLGVLIIMSCALNSNRLKKMLGFPVMRLIGKVSYGIYLCHTIMLAFFTPVLISWLNNAGITNRGLVLIAVFIITTSGTVGIAFILHHLVELRFIDLGKKVNAFLWPALKKVTGKAQPGLPPGDL